MALFELPQGLFVGTVDPILFVVISNMLHQLLHIDNNLIRYVFKVITENMFGVLKFFFFKLKLLFYVPHLVSWKQDEPVPQPLMILLVTVKHLH